MDRLGEGERQVRLGQDRLAIKNQQKKTETNGNYVRCFTHTRVFVAISHFHPGLNICGQGLEPHLPVG